MFTSKYSTDHQARMDITTNNIPVVAFADVVARAELRAQDLIRFSNEVPGDIQDAIYTQFLTEAVTDIAILPVEREAQDLPLSEDDDERSLMDTMRRIVSITALKFNRSLGTVEQDLVRIMKAYPTVDVREAATLRHKGLLH
jgi:hypothetical protein